MGRNNGKRFRNRFEQLENPAGKELNLLSQIQIPSIPRSKKLLISHKGHH
jgi:hypothetical protein